MNHRLTELGDDYVILKLKPGTLMNSMLDYGDSDFLSYTATPSELSLICSQEKADKHSNIVAERSSGWRCLRLETTSEPSEVPGIIASVVSPLASAGISVFAIASYDTDHILVQNVTDATVALTAAGHLVQRHNIS